MLFTPLPIPPLFSIALYRIVVAAPNGTAANAAVNNTGIVFECPLTQGSCTPLHGNGTGVDVRLYDTEGM